MTLLPEPPVYYTYGPRTLTIETMDDGTVYRELQRLMTQTRNYGQLPTCAQPAWNRVTH